MNDNWIKNVWKYKFEEIILTLANEIIWHEISHLLLRYVIYNSYFFITPMKELKALGNK